MGYYELTLILRGSLPREEEENLLKEIKEFIKKEEGEVLGEEFLGRRELAYELKRSKKEKEGILHELILSLKPEKVKVVEEWLKGKENLPRFLIIRRKEAPPKEERK